MNPPRGTNGKGRVHLWGCCMSVVVFTCFKWNFVRCVREGGGGGDACYMCFFFFLSRVGFWNLAPCVLTAMGYNLVKYKEGGRGGRKSEGGIRRAVVCGIHWLSVGICSRTWLGRLVCLRQCRVPAHPPVLCGGRVLRSLMLAPGSPYRGTCPCSELPHKLIFPRAGGHVPLLRQSVWRYGARLKDWWPLWRPATARTEVLQLTAARCMQCTMHTLTCGLPVLLVCRYMREFLGVYTRRLMHYILRFSFFEGSALGSLSVRFGETGRGWWYCLWAAIEHRQRYL